MAVRAATICAVKCDGMSPKVAPNPDAASCAMTARVSANCGIVAARARVAPEMTTRSAVERASMCERNVTRPMPDCAEAVSNFSTTADPAVKAFVVRSRSQ